VSLTYWLTNEGEYKLAELAGGFYSLLLTNPLVACWQWLLFTFLTSLMWTLLFTHFDARFKVDTAVFVVIALLVAPLVAAFYRDSRARREQARSAFTKLLHSSNAVMHMVHIYVTSESARIKYKVFNGRAYVLSNELVGAAINKRISMLLNAILTARRWAMLGGEFSPCPTR
jgi:hypothetical protein